MARTLRIPFAGHEAMHARVFNARLLFKPRTIVAIGCERHVYALSKRHPVPPLFHAVIPSSYSVIVV